METKEQGMADGLEFEEGDQLTRIQAINAETEALKAKCAIAWNKADNLDADNERLRAENKALRKWIMDDRCLTDDEITERLERTK